MPFDDSKMREMILFFAKRSEQDPRFGAIKLNKLLWFADARNWYATGRSISGVEYHRQPFGPVPRPLPAIREQMKASGELRVDERELSGSRTQKRIVALREPDLTVFEDAELAMMERVFGDLLPMTADQVSKQSHGLIWERSLNGEKMEFAALLLEESRPFEPSEADREWARQAAAH